jgi:hypothetical protein
MLSFYRRSLLIAITEGIFIELLWMLKLGMHIFSRKNSNMVVIERHVCSSQTPQHTCNTNVFTTKFVQWIELWWQTLQCHTAQRTKIGLPHAEVAKHKGLLIAQTNSHAQQRMPHRPSLKHKLAKPHPHPWQPQILTQSQQQHQRLLDYRQAQHCNHMLGEKQGTQTLPNLKIQ